MPFSESPPAPAYLVESIERRVAEVRAHIEAACARAGRDPGGVTLVAVTKTFPHEVIAAAAAAGLHDLGENKVQELTEKAGALPGARHGGAVRWHMIGHLQRNKAKDVAATADVFHALDSRRLARELEKRCAAEGRVLDCFVQANVSGEDSKYGLAPEDVVPFVEEAAGHAHLRLVGLMTLAAPADDPEDVRPQFRRLHTLAARCRALGLPRAPRDCLSMGMSGDYEVAVEEGATHVRLGTALFGPRT